MSDLLQRRIARTAKSLAGSAHGLYLDTAEFAKLALNDCQHARYAVSRRSS
jgi:hypothetical protein